MTTATEVATTTGPQGLAPLGAVAQAFDRVDYSDIVLPRIFLMQPLSEFVKEGLAKSGEMLFATGTDDPSPVHLIGGDAGESFDAYVVARRKFAATTSGGGMTFHPDNKRDPNDSDSWEGWFFDLAITEHEPMLPVRWMLWKTAGTPAAKQINTLIERAMHSGDADPVRIRVSVREKTSKRGMKYHAPVVGAAPPDKDELAIALRIQQASIELQSARSVENVAPTIEQPSFS